MIRRRHTPSRSARLVGTLALELGLVATPVTSGAVQPAQPERPASHASPGDKANVVPGRSIREPYRLTKIGRSSVAPSGDIVATAAPSVLLRSGETYRVWTAGRLRTLAPTAAGGRLSIDDHSVNGRGDVAGNQYFPENPDSTEGAAVRWLADGSTMSLTANPRARHGFMTDSGGSVTQVQASFRYFGAFWWDATGTGPTTLFEANMCNVTGVSDTAVAVGNCGSMGWWPPVSGWISTPIALTAPALHPDRRVACTYDAISAHAARVQGTCSYHSDSVDPPVQDVTTGVLWNATTGAVLADDVPPSVVDVDDSGRLLIATRGADGQDTGTLLWVNGTATPLTSLVRLSSRERLSQPRFDAHGDIVAVLVSNRTTRTTWQAVRLTAR